MPIDQHGESMAKILHRGEAVAMIAVQDKVLAAGRHVDKETGLVVDHLVTAVVRARVRTAAIEKVLVVKSDKNARKVRASG